MGLQETRELLLSYNLLYTQDKYSISKMWDNEIEKFRLISELSDKEIIEMARNYIIFEKDFIIELESTFKIMILCKHYRERCIDTKYKKNVCLNKRSKCRKFLCSSKMLNYILSVNGLIRKVRVKYLIDERVRNALEVKNAAKLLYIFLTNIKPKIRKYKLRKINSKLLFKGDKKEEENKLPISLLEIAKQIGINTDFEHHLKKLKENFKKMGVTK
jgi:hypothetical protein